MPHPLESLQLSQVDPNGVLPIEAAQPLFNSYHTYHGTALWGQSYDAGYFDWRNRVGYETATNTHQGVALRPLQATCLNSCTTNPSPQGPLGFCGIPLSHSCWPHDNASMQLENEKLQSKNVVVYRNESVSVDQPEPAGEALPAQSLVEDFIQWEPEWMAGAVSRDTQLQTGVADTLPFGWQLISDIEKVGQREQSRADDKYALLSTGYESFQAYNQISSVQDNVANSRRSTAKKKDKDSLCGNTRGSSIVRNEFKGQRKKLTMEQKRCNHIRYEKKRRSLIRERFAALAELVPSVEQENWPKSKVLFHTVEWLQALLERNKALQEQLYMLKHSNKDKLMNNFL